MTDLAEAPFPTRRSLREAPLPSRRSLREAGRKQPAAAPAKAGGSARFTAVDGFRAMSEEERRESA